MSNEEIERIIMLLNSPNEEFQVNGVLIAISQGLTVTELAKKLLWGGWLINKKFGTYTGEKRNDMMYEIGGYLFNMLKMGDGIYFTVFKGSNSFKNRIKYKRTDIGMKNCHQVTYMSDIIKRIIK